MIRGNGVAGRVGGEKGEVRRGREVGGVRGVRGKGKGTAGDGG